MYICRKYRLSFLVLARQVRSLSSISRPVRPSPQGNVGCCPLLRLPCFQNLWPCIPSRLLLTSPRASADLHCVRAQGRSCVPLRRFMHVLGSCDAPAQNHRFPALSRPYNHQEKSTWRILTSPPPWSTFTAPPECCPSRSGASGECSRKESFLGRCVSVAGLRDGVLLIWKITSANL